MVGNQRKIRIAGGDEGDGDDVDPEDRCKALAFERRRCQLEIMGPGKKVTEGGEAPILLGRYRVGDLAGRADRAEATARSPSRAYSTAVRTQSLWLSAYRYSRLKAGVTPGTALPDDLRMMFEFVRVGAGRRSPRSQRRDQSVRGIPEMRAARQLESDRDRRHCRADRAVPRDSARGSRCPWR
jgi:hypothetical protein